MYKPNDMTYIHDRMLHMRETIDKSKIETVPIDILLGAIEHIELLCELVELKDKRIQVMENMILLLGGKVE